MTAADVYIQTPPLLTAEEAMLVLRIGRSNVYEKSRTANKDHLQRHLTNVQPIPHMLIGPQP